MPIYHSDLCRACGLIVQDITVDPFLLGATGDPHQTHEVFFPLCRECAAALNLKDGEELF